MTLDRALRIARRELASNTNLYFDHRAQRFAAKSDDAKEIAEAYNALTTFQPLAQALERYTKGI